jgi:hypothetical protein
MLAAQHLYPEQALVFKLDNLHADWANFVVMAGGVGLFAWLILLLSPLLLLMSPLARKDRALLLGAVLLTSGQAVLGISNAMFGVLPQTMVYAVVLGYFFARTLHISLNCGSGVSTLSVQSSRSPTAKSVTAVANVRPPRVAGRFRYMSCRFLIGERKSLSLTQRAPMPNNTVLVVLNNIRRSRSSDRCLM